MNESLDAEIRVVDQGAIQWVDDAVPSGLPCTVCGSVGPHRPILDVPTLSAPQRMLRLIRCAACESAFFDPPDIRDFSDLGQRREEFWRFYVEVGGGVWETIWPVLADVSPGPRSLLDVGCGFGFALDFWKRSNGGVAEGIELADYGRVGSRMLGVTIHSSLLENCAELAGRKFDVVYASEVIEHVPDPRAFVALLSRWVADDGVLVMTTPCASFIEKDNVSPTLLAALAPGFHGFLLSPAAFAETARRAGFEFVEVRPFNERMVMWASHVPRTIDPDPEVARNTYFEYMAERFALRDEHSIVWEGFAYRYLRDLVNTGRLEQAKVVATGLTNALTARHGGELLAPEKMVPRLWAARTLGEAGSAAPYFLPNLYYFLASVYHRVDRDVAKAERYYVGAAAAIEASARLGPLFYLEAISLYWPARRSVALMQLARGDVASGSQAFARIADGLDRAVADTGIDAASAQFIETSLPPVAERLLTQGDAGGARTVANAYRRHVARVYGETLLNALGIESAMRAQSPVPENPIFPIWFEAMEHARQPASSPTTNQSLRDTIRLADAFASDPRFGRQLRDAAQRAQTLLPIDPAAGVHTFETSATWKWPAR